MEDLVPIPEELLQSLRVLSEEYKYRPGSHHPVKPPKAEVEQRILAFGIGDAATVASLILGVWGLITRPGCTFSGPMTGRCRAKIIHAGYDPAKQQVVLVCAAGHAIIQRKSRIYR